MKTIIAGMRDFFDSDVVYHAIKAANIEITEVVCGCASGVDTIGCEWAADHNVPVKKFPADWDRYGRAAGPRRNTAMANNADALIAVWDCASRGTKNMIETALNLNLKVFVYCLYPESAPLWLLNSKAVLLK